MLSRAIAIEVAALSLVAGVAAAPASQVRSVVATTVYFTAVDQKGNYVDDLTPADLIVKDGGKVREILRAGPSSLRLKISLVVDDNLAPNDIVRLAAAAFAERLQARADIALYLMGGGTTKLLDFNASPARFRQALNDLPRRSHGGGSLVESMYQIVGETRRL